MPSDVYRDYLGFRLDCYYPVNRGKKGVSAQCS